MMESAECGYCGESFRRGRRSCPHCGSDAETGWKDEDEIQAESVELGGMSDDAYADFLAREGLGEDKASRANLAVILVTIAMIGLLAWVALT
jgi:hypothetical protein